MSNKRSAGILLPIFSLPDKYGIGCFSDEARKFADFLKTAGQHYWQILPLGPTGYGDSPYQSFSTFAGNPYFIDLKELIRQGLLTAEECDEALASASESSLINYGLQYTKRLPLLKMAYQRSRHKDTEEFKAFTEHNSYWLKDYALFMAAKDSFGGQPLTAWDEDLSMYRADAEWAF